MLILYDLVQKDGETFKRTRVHTLSMVYMNGAQELYATIFTGEKKDEQDVKDTVLVDEMNAWLFQGTGAFDKNGKVIFHGHILKDKDDTLYEVFYANGAYFIVKDEIPLMLLDQHVRELEIVGDVVQDLKLIEKPVDEKIFNQTKQ